jgi:hypothetical protein
MFYTTEHGVLTSLNCDIQPNTDVSGIGIRCALYIQAIFSLLLVFKIRTSTEIVFNNVSLQVAAIGLIAAAYFDETIDVPHTIMVSHLSVMMSSCRATVSSCSLGALRSSGKLSQAIFTIYLLDIIFCPIIMVFNYVVWNVIRRAQTQNDLCPSGLGQLVFFGTESEIGVSSFASKAAFAFVIVNITLEGSRYVAECGRIWQWSRHNTDTVTRPIGFDPRLWWLWTLLSSRFEGWDWKERCRQVAILSLCHKLCIWIYTLWTIEKMVEVNNINSEDLQWSFGQIFALTNMLALLVFLCSRYWKFIRLISTFPSGCLMSQSGHK